MTSSIFNSLLKVWMRVIFLATISFCCVYIHAEWIVTPENLALVVGQRGVLNCTSNTTTSRGISWFYAQTGVPEYIIACRDDPDIDPVYSWDSTTPGSCNLIIWNVTVLQAGLYQCLAPITEGEAVNAQLIVLESNPECSTRPTDSVRVDETVTMSCSVRCRGAIEPNMTWYDSDNSELPSINQGPTLVPNYTTSVTAKISTVLPHTCKTLFTVAPPPSVGVEGRYADNPPRYTSQCQTKSLLVQYPPYADNITITPDTSGDLYPGHALTCNATTEPAVNFYQWFNETGAPMVNDTRLVLDEVGENLTYICTAANQLGLNSTQIVINVIPVPETTTSTLGSQPSITSSSSGSGGQNTSSSERPGPGDNLGVILGAVFGCLAAVLTATLLVCFFVPSCPLHKKCRGKDPQSNARFSDPGFEQNSRETIGQDHHTNIKATVNKQELRYVELKADPSLLRRRFTQAATHIPYYDENDSPLPYNNEENTVYSAVNGA